MFRPDINYLVDAATHLLVNILTYFGLKRKAVEALCSHGVGGGGVKFPRPPYPTVKKLHTYK